MESDKKISVKEIAALAGTSVATVSRVLNHNGRFSKETEARVLEVIEKYGYEPNTLARGLRAKHTKIVGILVPDIGNEFYASMVRRLQQAFLEKGYLTIICSSSENPEEALKYVHMLKGQKADGLIYIGSCDIEQELKLPTVYLDREPIHTDGQKMIVECDNELGGYLAGQELIKKGCRRIGFVAYDLAISTHAKRLTGLKCACEEAGLKLEFILEASEVSLKEGSCMAQKILKCFPQTDGIFFASDWLALGALHYLSERRIAVPERLKVVGFDDLSISSVNSPELTTIRQPVDEMSLVATRKMLDMIELENVECKRITLGPKIVVRRTT